MQFDGILTLTHNGTSLVLPGNEDIVTGAGDISLWQSEGSGNWRCVTYTRRDGGTVFETVGDTLASASVATTMGSAATGQFYDVSGSTAITALGTLPAGRRRIVRFTGSLALTHNGTSLILPGSRNITTVNGDKAEFVSLGSGNWLCLWYNRGTQPPDLNITLGTEQASTSGTAIDFTSIPSGVKRIVVMFVGVSTSGTNIMRVQLGDSGGIETAGYTGGIQSAGGNTAYNGSAGFDVVTAMTAADVHSGAATFTLENASGFLWVCTSLVTDHTNVRVHYGSGYKALSAELTQLRITTVGGTDTFDAGAVNIHYES